MCGVTLRVRVIVCARGCGGALTVCVHEPIGNVKVFVEGGVVICAVYGLKYVVELRPCKLEGFAFGLKVPVDDWFFDEGHLVEFLRNQLDDFFSLVDEVYLVVNVEHEFGKPVLPLVLPLLP